MSGIKDLLSLHHWLRDSQNKKSPLEKALHNSRCLPRRKIQLLKDLDEEMSKAINRPSLRNLSNNLTTR